MTDEVARLEKLRLYSILDTGPEQSFDALTEMASVLLKVPMAAITLVDGDRQWFKSKVGLTVTELPRDTSLCTHTIEQNDVFEVSDAPADPRFASNPLVTGPAQLRFYAGAPLVMGGGDCLGTLCVLDRQPRHLTELDRRHLKNLAAQVVSLLELRRLLAVREQEAIEARAALMRADRLAMVGQLAAGVAHELGTPLAVISGRAKMMQASSVPADQWPTHARVISEQSERMTGIIHQMLDLTRRREPRKVNVDLRNVARQTLVMLLTEAKKRNVELSYAADDTERLAQLDASQFVQVASNLVMNALQATPEGRRVVVSTGHERRAPPADLGGVEQDWVYLRVKDEGSGIAPEHLHRVFEPFFTTKKSREGTGLGLAVAGGIVRDHQGWIDLQSDATSGSRFTVYAPQTPASH